MTDCRALAGRSLQEVLALFIAIKSAKYKAILAIAYGAGLRVSEVCALKPTDIDSQRMVIHVRRGKGNKDRYVLLGENLFPLLREYYQTARRKGDYLFPGQKPQNPLTTTSIWHVLKKVGGIPLKVLLNGYFSQGFFFHRLAI